MIVSMLGAHNVCQQDHDPGHRARWIASLAQKSTQIVAEWSQTRVESAQWARMLGSNPPFSAKTAWIRHEIAMPNRDATYIAKSGKNTPDRVFRLFQARLAQIAASCRDVAGCGEKLREPRACAHARHYSRRRVYRNNLRSEFFDHRFDDCGEELLPPTTRPKTPAA